VVSPRICYLKIKIKIIVNDSSNISDFDRKSNNTQEKINVDDGYNHL